MRTFMIVALISSCTLLAGCASVTTAGERVQFAKSEDDVFGCVDKGTVSVKGMGSLEDARNSIRNKAAEAGANVIRVTREDAFWGIAEGKAFNCDPEAASARNSALKASANRMITCVQGNDCEYKWSRAMEWVQENSSWKFRTVTDSLLTTEGPLDTAKPAFEVAKLSQGDGQHYRITFRSWCGAGNCEELILKLHSAFNDFVETPPAAVQR